MLRFLAAKILAIIIFSSYCTDGNSGVSEGKGKMSIRSSNSGSGRSREMDEEEKESEEEECAEALTSEEDEGEDITSSTAYTAVSCSLLCMDDVVNTSNHQVYQVTLLLVNGCTQLTLFFPEIYFLS